MADFYTELQKRIAASNPYTNRLASLDKQIGNINKQYTGYGEEAREDRARATRNLDRKRAQMAKEQQSWLTNQYKQGARDAKTTFRDNLAQQQRTGREAIQAAGSTALRQQMEQRRRLAEQANARLKQPARAPNIVPTLSPLQEITGVQLNDDMAGTNTATNSFFIAPESVASNYNVAGSPLGGGIGGRQRASSTDLTSRSDTLGAKRKDEL